MSLVLLLAPAAWACGPYFPITILDQGADAVWSAPVSDFAADVRMLYDAPKAPDAWGQSVRTAAPEDLKAALGKETPAVDGLRAMRDKTHGWRPQPVTQDDVPGGLPDEFRLYAEGAVAWHSGDIDTARQRWEAVLALPAGQRRYRSTWAAFMLGRAAQGSADTEAWMEKTRALASEGFHDSLGLSSATHGHAAHKLLWNEGNLAAATDLYLKQLHESGSGVGSLRIVARMALDAPDLGAIAQDDDLRKLTTAWLIAYGSEHERATKWLDTLEQAGLGTDGADRLAWASYQAGDMDRAARWLDRAEDTPTANWIAARLKMRAGDLEAAEQHLKKAGQLQGEWGSAGWYSRSEENGVRPGHEALAERGVVLTRQERYAEALDAFVEADHWLDAAYIAERILTPDELKAHVDTRYPTADSDEASALRDLLARRLVRDGHSGEAIAYFRPDTRPHAEAYAGALATAGERGIAPLKKAEALWSAAQLAREHGMQLRGTELGPDFAWIDGFYGGPFLGEARLEHVTGPLAPTDTERARAEDSLPSPNRRYHYRYVAAEHAWQAAALLPDDDDVTVKVLCQAGQWLRYQDPKSADRYYKAMVTRGWNNSLSQLADKNRWLPAPARCELDGFNVTEPMPEVGCATAPGRAWWGLGLLALGLVARRRR